MKRLVHSRWRNGEVDALILLGTGRSVVAAFIASGMLPLQ